MEGTNEVQRKRKKTRPPRGAARRTIGPHAYSRPFEVRRKAVQSCGEESIPPGAGGPRNGGGPQHLVQAGEVVPRPGRSGLAVQVGRSEPSEADHPHARGDN